MPPIRVASVPEGHVYVRHLSPVIDDGTVARLPDPRPADDAIEGQWWPPRMLDPGWIRAHQDEFDVFHVHFGFDALAESTLRTVLDELDTLGKPLLYTVHDLRNPHHAEPDAHARHLALLIERASALVTITPGAASAVEQTWGRRPVVLPHPHVVEFDRQRQDVPRLNGRYTVGLHAKSVRPSMDPLPVIGALLPLIGELPELRLVVNVHHDVADTSGDRHEPHLMRFLHEAASSGAIELAVHDCYSDAALWDYLQSLDLSVLPYRFGTHSGWLEACHDLGTAVLAPTCGFYAEQRPCLSYRLDETVLDADSLRDAVRAGYEQRPAWRADPEVRAEERDDIARRHLALYESVLR